MRFFLPIALLVASVASGIPTAHAAVVPDATVFLLPGESAAGAPSGVIFDQLISNPTLNNDGKVAFHALLEGEGIGFENRGGVWSNSSDSLALVARTNNPAPGLPSDVVFQNFLGDILLNNAGDVAFLGTLTAETPEQYSIWSGGDAGITLIAREGQQAPGLPSGISFSSFWSLRLNSAGQVAFSSILRGSGINGTNDEAIWSEKQGTLAAIARNGEQASGLPPGVNFAYFGSFERSVPAVSFNSLGQTAFLAGLSGPGVSQTNDRGLWSEATGSLTLVVRRGDQAPGTSTGVSFDRFGSPALNSQGHTVFTASLTGNGVNKSNSVGIWVSQKNTLTLLARAGDTAPGLSGGVTFRGFDIAGSSDLPVNPQINMAGAVAFRAELSGDGVSDNNDNSIWSDSSGMLTMLVREGDQAPGLPDGVVFSGFDLPVLNTAGQLAFRGFITGNGIDPSNDIGIWAQDRAGTLQLIARAGDMLEVSHGRFIQIGGPSFAVGSGEQGESTGFNDRGQLAIYAGGIGFISNRVAVPEPSQEAFVAIASVLFCMFTPSWRELGIQRRWQ